MRVCVLCVCQCIHDKYVYGCMVEWYLNACGREGILWGTECNIGRTKFGEEELAASAHAQLNATHEKATNLLFGFLFVPVN